VLRRNIYRLVQNKTISEHLRDGIVPTVFDLPVDPVRSVAGVRHHRFDAAARAPPHHQLRHAPCPEHLPARLSRILGRIVA